jgi:hypothetical protein
MKMTRPGGLLTPGPMTQPSGDEMAGRQQRWGKIGSGFAERSAERFKFWQPELKNRRPAFIVSSYRVLWPRSDRS